MISTHKPLIEPERINSGQDIIGSPRIERIITGRNTALAQIEGGVASLS
ncbi:hypothetical protein [Yersinia intermedia]|nr:hypothetical protein [Yersinia intermedia]CNE30594.1 Uncharacterised protein [Yersinia intermedia]